mmetsp:Transcript_27578/g.57910  ORF Transcript_27578/g.57910 Transcript_27578/m.57910 type:complete len:202 (-) Transcript_27578:1836-2441(-)
MILWPRGFIFGCVTLLGSVQWAHVLNLHSVIALRIVGRPRWKSRFGRRFHVGSSIIVRKHHLTSPTDGTQIARHPTELMTPDAHRIILRHSRPDHFPDETGPSRLTHNLHHILLHSHLFLQSINVPFQRGIPLLLCLIRSLDLLVFVSHRRILRPALVDLLPQVDDLPLQNLFVLLQFRQFRLGRILMHSEFHPMGVELFG